MPGGVSTPTEIILAIYLHLLGHVGKGMGMCWKCFGNLQFPTDACQEVYPYPLKSSWKFTLIYRGMLARVWPCTESISEIYHFIPRHARRCIHTHRNCFGNLWWSSVASQKRYGHLPKVFREFTVPYQAIPGGVSMPTEIVSAISPNLPRRVGKGMGCTESVLVTYRSLPRHAGRCIHTHRNCFGNLWWPCAAAQQRYEHALKMFR